MNDSKFEKIFDVLNFKKTEIAQYFYVYGMRFVQTARQMKAQGYSGSDVAGKVNEFDAELNKKLSKLLDETEQIFLKSGRKLSSEQYGKLSSTYAKVCRDIIGGFKGVVSQEFEVAGSLEIIFNTMGNRCYEKITKYFDAMNVLQNTKIDKILWISVVSMVVATLSLLITAVDVFCR